MRRNGPNDGQRAIAVPPQHRHEQQQQQVPGRFEGDAVVDMVSSKVANG